MSLQQIKPFEISCDRETANRAGVLAKRLEMGTMVVAESLTRLHIPISRIQGAELSMEMGFDSGFNYDENAKILTSLVKIHCKSKLEHSIGDLIAKGSDVFTVVVHYALETTLSQDFDLPADREEHMKAFASINAPMTVWPIWREFLLSATARMGVPPITAPFLRVEVSQDSLPRVKPE